MSDIAFEEVWNDPIKLKRLCGNKDLFINVTFMDYNYGYAKKNIYYTLFPTEPYLNIKGWILNNFIFPIFSKLVKPMEFINKPELTLMKSGHYMHVLDECIRIAFSYLKPNNTYLIKFSIFLENFFKGALESYDWQLEEASIIKKEVFVNHETNVIHYYGYFKPVTSTVYLELKKKTKCPETVYFLYPKIINIRIPEFMYRLLYEKARSRLRAGIFNNILNRLSSYQTILADSEFTQLNIKRYWKKKTKILYPPVELMFKKNYSDSSAKKNWITSVGRFFTLGHGKRQEILINAFKKLYDSGLIDWELHLVGGVGNEPSSLAFVEKLKKDAQNYPVFFHFNASRKQVVQILLDSKIYWHAAGYGEDEIKNPIKFEHFGIAPIEAISAGCYPILYKGGGLKEIITKLELDENIHLFSNIEHLVELSKKAVSFTYKNTFEFLNERLKKNLLKFFSTDTFLKQFTEIVSH
jgi:glycosyltransferase involved in cell wall biosynthesis